MRQSEERICVHRFNNKYNSSWEDSTIISAANVSEDLSLARKALMKIKWSHKWGTVKKLMFRQKFNALVLVESRGKKLNIPLQYEISEMESSK